jgi:hypothetical protein
MLFASAKFTPPLKKKAAFCAAGANSMKCNLNKFLARLLPALLYAK